MIFPGRHTYIHILHEYEIHMYTVVTADVIYEIWNSYVYCGIHAKCNLVLVDKLWGYCGDLGWMWNEAVMTYFMLLPWHFPKLTGMKPRSMFGYSVICCDFWRMHRVCHACKIISPVSSFFILTSFSFIHSFFLLSFLYYFFNSMPFSSALFHYFFPPYIPLLILTVSPLQQFR